MRYKAVTLGLVLAGTALGSSALTLGRARGAAWIGQNLDLQIPVQVDPGQTDAALCAEADVFNGDIRQDNSRIQIQSEASGQADTYNLRITSSVPVDEPVVTVYVRAGCGQKSSRKFVLLADFPPEPQGTPVRLTPVAPQVPTIAAPAAPIDNAATSSAAQSTAISPSASSAENKAQAKPAKASPAKAAPKEITKDAPKEPKAPAPAKKETPPAAKAEKAPDLAATGPKASGKPRLRLDPVETLAERVKNLEVSTTQSNLQDDLGRDAQKMQQLQSDLRTLLDQAVKNEASLAAMRERLEKAESDRVPVALVYGLVALVAACVGALAYLWTRRNKAIRWEGEPSATRSRPQPKGADGA